MVSVTLLAALCMTASAYSGHISPATSKIAGLLALTFPAWIAFCLLAALIDLLLCRRAALIALVAFIACAGPVLDICPLHISDKTPEPGARTFTLLTYNVFHFSSTLPDNPYPADINPTVSYIIGSGADIVAMEECRPLKPNDALHITEAQIDSLEKAYPYRYYDSKSQNGLISKWPFEILDIFKGSDLTASVLAADVFIESDTLRIYTVHLKSFELNDNDKKLYHDIATLDGGRKELKEAKSVLIGKITTANSMRAANADTLKAIIDANTAKNVVMCGDFNDVPASYTLRTLCQADGRLAQVYSQVGFGPMVTYNRRSFPFRIDHVLCKGRLSPIDMWHGDLRSSDHYPVFATFQITDR